MSKLCQRSLCAIVAQEGGSLVTNKDMISVLLVLSEASSAGKLLFSSQFMIPAVSCCRLFVQDRALPIACAILVAEPVREIPQQKPLGNIDHI